MFDFVIGLVYAVGISRAMDDCIRRRRLLRLRGCCRLGMNRRRHHLDLRLKPKMNKKINEIRENHFVIDRLIY